MVLLVLALAPLSWAMNPLYKKASALVDFSTEENLEIDFKGEALNNEQLQKNRGPKYKKQNELILEWDKIDAANWNSFELWQLERELKDRYPKWKVAQKERLLVEMVGRFIDCVGVCQSYRGAGVAKAQFRSSILEGDEIVTLKDSYAWIFLMDGTMVRLSPESSISFKEINISNQQIFFHARVNYGNVLWLNRLRESLDSTNDRETDALFLPLAYYESNPEEREKKLDENRLYEFLTEDYTTLSQYQKANKLIEENNQKMHERQTLSLIVTPNGSILGSDLMLEMVVLEWGKSYIKNRSYSIYKAESKATQEASFFYRGLLNREQMDLEVETWYEVSEDGEEIHKMDDGQLNFSFGEYLTKRIPTLFVAREMMLKDYSFPLFKKSLKENDMAQVNYHLWNGPDKIAQDEIAKRLDYLKEHTRREETTLRGIRRQYKERLEKRGEKIEESHYGDQFYSKAFNYFMVSGERRKEYETGEEVLNSTNKKFWKLIHHRKNYSTAR